MTRLPTSQIIAADLTVDRRDDPGKLVAEPGDLHALLEGLHPGLGLVDHGLLLIELLLADRAGRRRVDGPVAREGGPGQPERGLVEIDLALSLVELGLVRPRIDHEQQVPRLDLRSFLERHLDQVTGHSGTDVHWIDGLGSAGEVDVVGDLPLDGLADRHHRRLGRRDLGRIGLATGHRGQQKANKPSTQTAAMSMKLRRKRGLDQALHCDTHVESISRGENQGGLSTYIYTSVFRRPSRPVTDRSAFAGRAAGQV